MTERKGLDDETGIEGEPEPSFSRLANTGLAWIALRPPPCPGLKNSPGPSGQSPSICRGIYNPVVCVEGLTVNLSLWKESCKTKDISAQWILSPPQEDKMQVLNDRSGEEGLVARNAAVWTDKILNISVCKQIPLLPFGEILLAGRDLAALWCGISATWPMPTSGSLCEFTSLAMNQSTGYYPAMSLEQNHAQGVGWRDWGSSCTPWSLKAKQFPHGVSWGYLLCLPDLRPAGTLICLVVLLRASGGSHSAPFWRLTDRRGSDTRPLQSQFPFPPHPLEKSSVGLTILPLDGMNWELGILSITGIRRRSDCRLAFPFMVSIENSPGSV